MGFTNCPATSNQAGGLMGILDMFSRRSKRVIKKQPIEIAFDMLMNAMIIAYGYKHNKKFIPGENDLKIFDCFVEELSSSYVTARYISRCLHKRRRGEEEVSPKFSNPESFDYHYPK